MWNSSFKRGGFKKEGIRTPTGQILYESGLVPYFNDLIRKKNYKEILDDKFFDHNSIDKLLKEYSQGKEVGVNENFLRCLLSLLSVGYY